MNWFLLPASWLAFAMVSLSGTPVAAQFSQHQRGIVSEPSATSKFSSSFKNGFDRMTKALTPNSSSRESADPISLSVPAKPSAELHVAIARMAEQSGDLAKAEYHYREGLKLEPRHPDSLMGYAHMLDRQHKLPEAQEMYRLAVQAEPRNATMHNDLGICYARQGKLDEAIASLEKAIQLRPNHARYRNNIATVLVQSNRVDEAFNHLSAVHSEAVAFYNMGYLLHKAGNEKGAARLFEEALSLDPSLTAARAWLKHLESSPGMSERERQPEAVARNSAATRSNVVPPAGTAAPLPGNSAAQRPRAGTLAPQADPIPPLITPAQMPPQQLAPLPSIKRLPPTNPAR